jgi:hypothetical protein
MHRIVGSGVAVGWQDGARRMAARGDPIRMRLQPERDRVTSYLAAKVDLFASFSALEACCRLVWINLVFVNTLCLVRSK